MEINILRNRQVVRGDDFSQDPPARGRGCGSRVLNYNFFGNSSAPLAGSASGDRVALFRCYVSRFCVWAAADFSVHKRVMKVPVSAHPESDSRAIKRAPRGSPRAVGDSSHDV